MNSIDISPHCPPNRVGWVWNIPFLIPGDTPDSKTSDFASGSTGRYSSVVCKLVCPSQLTLRMSPAASSVWIAQECARDLALPVLLRTVADDGRFPPPIVGAIPCL